MVNGLTDKAGFSCCNVCDLYIFFFTCECFGALEMSNGETKDSHKFRESIKYNGNEQQKMVMCISAVIRYISHQAFSIGFIG